MLLTLILTFLNLAISHNLFDMCPLFRIRFEIRISLRSAESNHGLSPVQVTIDFSGMHSLTCFKKVGEQFSVAWLTSLASVIN